MKPANLKLKAEIVLQGKKAIDVANAADMTKYSFSRKINGHAEFTESEIKAISAYLNKSPTEIFFDNEVANSATKTA